VLLQREARPRNRRLHGQRTIVAFLTRSNDSPVAAFVVGAAGGALVGALIGAAIPKWHRRARLVGGRRLPGIRHA
jgi:hypothetical protein